MKRDWQILSRRALLFGASAAAGAAAGSLASRSLPARPEKIVNVTAANEWPDPQFQIADACPLVPKLRPDLGGMRPPVSVSSYVWDNALYFGPAHRTVTCLAPSTSGLRDGELVRFDGYADAALRGSALRVFDVIPDTSFRVRPEYKDGKPAQSKRCACQPVTRGDYTGVAGGAVTTNVQRYGNGKSPNVWIEDTPEFVTPFKGAVRVIVVQKTTHEPEYILWNCNRDSLPIFSERARALGCAVFIPSGFGAASAQVCFNNGGTIQRRDITSGKDRRQWIEGTTVVVNNPTLWQEGVELRGSAGAWFILAEFVSVPGIGPIGDGCFSTPRKQILEVAASLSPWIGADITSPLIADDSGVLYSFEVDMYQASNGVIGPGVSACSAQLEGQSDKVGNAFGCRTAMFPPTTFSNGFYAKVANRPVDVPGAYEIANAELYLRDGKFVAQTNGPGQRWTFLSWDIGRVTLF